MVFTRLRTEETLGYIVFFGAQRDETMANFRLIVQSDTFPPQFLNWRSERCMRYCAEELRSMPRSSFAKYIAARITELKQPFQKLSEATNDFWREINQATLTFDRKQRMLDALETMSQEDVATYFERHVVHPLTRRKMQMQMFGKTHAELLPSADESLTRVQVRPDSTDLEQAASDGCAISSDKKSFDTAVLEGGAVQRPGEDYVSFKERCGLQARRVGNLRDPKHRLPAGVDVKIDF